MEKAFVLIKRTLVIILGVLSIMLVFAGCSDNSGEDMTDELFKESKSGVELEIYREGDHVYTANEDYDITQYISSSDIEDAKHYMLTADVTFLNGGVAGYVDYPQIDRIISIDEINTSSKMNINATDASAE